MELFPDLQYKWVEEGLEPDCTALPGRDDCLLPVEDHVSLPCRHDLEIFGALLAVGEKGLGWLELQL